MPGSVADGYHFYLSSILIAIEQALCQLIEQFDIFWRPLSFPLENGTLSVQLTMVLHNFAIDIREYYATLFSQRKKIVGLSGCNLTAKRR